MLSDFHPDLGCVTTPTAEMLVLITTVAPSPAAFRAIHNAHRSFRVMPAQAFMARCGWRQVVISRRIREYWLNNRRDGSRIKSYANGTVHGQTYYCNGKRHGEFAKWCSTGQLISRMTWVDDMRHGVYTVMDMAGQPIIRAQYIHGILNGECTMWHTNGYVRERCTYVDGQVHGEYCLFQFLDGQLLEKCIYNHGVQI